ncbi:hypothetical protein ACIRP0_28520 [Streptomyces sp. NPDC101733]
MSAIERAAHRRRRGPAVVRLSIVAQHLGDGWRIRQYHVSRLS